MCLANQWLYLNCVFSVIYILHKRTFLFNLEQVGIKRLFYLALIRIYWFTPEELFQSFYPEMLAWKEAGDKGGKERHKRVRWGRSRLGSWAQLKGVWGQWGEVDSPVSSSRHCFCFALSLSARDCLPQFLLRFPTFPHCSYQRPFHLQQVLQKCWSR